MLVSVEYDVSYSYDNQVTVNDNVLRVFPSTEFWQKPIDEKVSINPDGKIIYYNDRFGNKNARIKITEIHLASSFKVISTVETSPYKVSINEAIDLPLPLDKSLLSSDVRMYLNPSTLINPELIRLRAPDIVDQMKTIREALTVLTEWVTTKIEYAPASTNVETKARESLALGRGVCQDKSHILIGFLRSLGIPSRYVSGILVDTPGATHAWVEAYWPNVGWVPLDPTHNRVFDLENYYVKYGHGRDYNDVAPITGYFESDSSHSLTQLNVIPTIIQK
jgi:transglutaminase-like putative cysteine protease